MPVLLAKKWLNENCIDYEGGRNYSLNNKEMEKTVFSRILIIFLWYR